MARTKDENWNLGEEGNPNKNGGNSYSRGHITLALLMDIRDELKALNQKLGWNGDTIRELRSLRRDMKERTTARCHRRHA